MSGPTLPLCKLLPWDTEFFGCRIARVCGDTMTPEQAVKIDDWSRNHKVDALYFLARTDDPATIRTAERHKFGLVDIRVTFERTAPGTNKPADASVASEMRIRPFKSGDLAALQAMARSGHGDTRFFNDPQFPQQRAEDLYSTWITLESQGRAQIVFVAVQADDQPVGYLSCHFDRASQEAQFGLVGVHPSTRGNGIGKMLVLAAIDWSHTQGARMITVVTQGKNRAAQRLFQRCGFITRDLQLWYHKWYSTGQ